MPFFFFFAPSNSKLRPHSVSMIGGSSLVKFGEVLQLPNLEELYANLKENEQKFRKQTVSGTEWSTKMERRR